MTSEKASNSMETAPKAQPNQLPSNVKLLGAASLLNDIASEMIYPLMPQFLIGVLGGNRLHLGIIEGFAESVSSLLKLGSGALSDRTGERKKLVVVGYALAAIARPILGVVTAPWQLFAARMTDRVGKGLRTAPRDALIADSTPATMRGRAFGFHRAMDHLGAALGPVLATLFLLTWPGELRTLFLLTLLPGLGVVGLLMYGLREPPNLPDPAAATSSPPRFTARPVQRSFRLYLLALVIFTLGNSSDAFLLVRATELGVSTAYLPLLWSAFHVVKSCGNLLAGRIADKIGSRPLIFFGWGIYALIYLAFAWIHAAWQVWTVFLLYGLFYAMTEPAEKKLVVELVGAEQKGLAFGWYNFAIGIAALPSSILFGWLYEQAGAVVAFGYGAALALIAIVVLSRVKTP
jgi:MFS family permease